MERTTKLTISYKRAPSSARGLIKLVMRKVAQLAETKMVIL